MEWGREGCSTMVNVRARGEGKQGHRAYIAAEVEEARTKTNFQLWKNRDIGGYLDRWRLSYVVVWWVEGYLFPGDKNSPRVEAHSQGNCR